jgi:type II secretory pathway pseudopilin PulG
MQRKKGQILVITLLVLTIIAIVTVSLVGLVSRDVKQVASSEQYEEAYNTSETQLKRILNEYGKPGVTLDSIITKFSGSGNDLNCVSTALQSYKCSVFSNEFSNASLQTEITVKDTNQVNNFEIYKDRSFDLNLSGYIGRLNFSWDKNAAIEFTLIYRDSLGAIQSVKDVYDAGSPRIFTSLAADSPYADPNTVDGIHPFNFQDIVSQPDASSVSFSISEILTLTGSTVQSSIGATGSTLSLKITPRMTSKFDSLLFSAIPMEGGLTNQVREFNAKSYNVTAGSSTPVANLETKIPLNPQPDSILDGSLLTNGVIKNN